MRRVLIISYYFPPDGGGGTQRAAKFARHLPACGWEPVVLTRTPPPRRTRWEPADDALLKDVAGVTCHHVPHVEGEAPVPMHPGRAADHHPWIRRAAKQARALISRERIDAVLITMPPYGLCALAWGLRERTGVPVIIDLRDPWALDGAPQYANRAQWRASRDAMHRTLSQADGVVANTPEAARVLTNQCDTNATTRGPRWATIPNGYDDDDFVDSSDKKLAATTALPGYTPGAFHLVHTGTFHSPAFARHRGLLGRVRKHVQFRARTIDVSGRTPLHLLRAVTQLQTRNATGIERLRLVFVGITDAETQRMVSAAGLDAITYTTGYVPHLVATRWMRSAGANFMPLHGLPTGERSRIVPGKLYEYLAAGQPILGAVPPGDAHDLLTQSGLARLTEPTDAAAMSDALEQLLADEPQSPGDDTPPVWLRRYERRRLTERLTALLNEVVQTIPAAETPNASPATTEPRPLLQTGP